MIEPLNPPAQADDHVDPPTPERVLLDEPEPAPDADPASAPPVQAAEALGPADAPDQDSTEPAPGPVPAVAEPGPTPDVAESAPAADPLDQATTQDDDDSVPDLTEDDSLARALEALLLVVDAPANEESLALALDQPVARVAEMLTSMSARYTEDERGIDLRRIGDGWRFVTRDRYAPFVEKLLLDGQRAKLTRAALETLAVIAYRQPVTRARVAAVRGVNVDGVIRTLLARGLIEETGTDAETGGILYRTTELFLERLGLSSLEDLPPIAPLLPEVDAIDDV